MADLWHYNITDSSFMCDACLIWTVVYSLAYWIRWGRRKMLRLKKRERETYISLLRSRLTENWFSNILFIKFLQDTRGFSPYRDAWNFEMEKILKKLQQIFIKKSLLRRVYMVFALMWSTPFLTKRETILTCFSLVTTRRKVFLKKSFIGV